MNKNILIISNDKLFIEKNIISSDYNDTVNIVESLARKNQLSFFCRTTNKINNYFVKLKKNKKIFKLTLFDLNKADNYKIFMISITPFNFLILILLKIFNKKISGFVYLRSDGYKEYYYKYSFFGYFIYNLMFKVTTSFLKIISVSKNLSGLKKNYILVNPSEIDNKWLLKRKKTNIDIPKLLYLGRYKKEKGVFSLTKIVNAFSFKYRLNIIGVKTKTHSVNKKIKFLRELNSVEKIINAYDECNIFILPSFTEGAPKVILESLARLRPIIVFDEIKHVKKNFKGVFICKRNTQDLKKKIFYILKNYNRIIFEIKKNNIFTKKDFQNKLNKIIK